MPVWWTAIHVVNIKMDVYEARIGVPDEVNVCSNNNNSDKCTSRREFLENSVINCMTVLRSLDDAPRIK